MPDQRNSSNGSVVGTSTWLQLGVATPATVARYAKRFEERCARYARAWQVCARADDRCRAEWMPAEKRRQERFTSEHPHLSAMDRSMPWNNVFREAADSVEFWMQELQELALLLTQSMAEHMPMPANSRLQGEVPQAKGKGRGKNKRKGAQQTHPIKSGTYSTTNQTGKQVCIKFNLGTCADDCPRAHQCSL